MLKHMINKKSTNTCVEMYPIDTQHTLMILTYSKYKSTKSVEVFTFPYLFELKITMECLGVDLKNENYKYLCSLPLLSFFKGYCLCQAICIVGHVVSASTTT